MSKLASVILCAPGEISAMHIGDTPDARPIANPLVTRDTTNTVN
jgi:hypothetical protein